ncbi:7TMR-DISM family protein [Pseudobacteriovorax antillogorgiicola]|uniref:7TM diverse intracellular signalling n=1 Tax=Pseudobacteriovorax antillogorgiicola TaxID=1513793 RepID=A0A1Y6CLS5_9BACT|nr:7TM-DISM domain-containing protein [Pseudobacteriovorax antillogorgiicola]TCS45454.1 7TM protein involved in diverse intracellular signaling [Pseudobacteriovorax antillogorgiicola]SMF74706.1 7TM diverse intracellular signalling [Pseudobacteriovorax antillogorgiicola]
MKYLFPSFIIYWAIAGIAGANPQLLDVDRGEDFYRLGHYLEILEDSSGALSFEEVKSAKTWRQSRQSQHAFGQTESTFWLRFKVSGSKHPRNMMLVTRKGFINETDYFVQRGDGSYHTIEIRNSRMSEMNGVDYRFPVINIPIQSQERTHYIRLRRTIALHATLDLWEPRAFMNFALAELFLMGGFYGTVFVMVLYNFLIYLNLREPYYLQYIGYVAALGIFQAWYDEVLFQYTSIRESNPLPSLIMGHACLWFSLFARSFLRLPELLWTRYLSRIRSHPTTC